MRLQRMWNPLCAKLVLIILTRSTVARNQHMSYLGLYRAVHIRLTAALDVEYA